MSVRLYETVRRYDYFSILLKIFSRIFMILIFNQKTSKLNIRATGNLHVKFSEKRGAVEGGFVGQEPIC